MSTSRITGCCIRALATAFQLSLPVLPDVIGLCMPSEFIFSPNFLVLFIISGVIPYSVNSRRSTATISSETLLLILAKCSVSIRMPTFFIRITRGTSSVSMSYMAYSGLLLFNLSACAQNKSNVIMQSLPLYSSISCLNSGTVLNSTSAWSHSFSFFIDAFL